MTRLQHQHFPTQSVREGCNERSVAMPRAAVRIALYETSAANPETCSGF